VVDVEGEADDDKADDDVDVIRKGVEDDEEDAVVESVDMD